MDNGLIARRYAKALYKLAKDHNDTQRVYEEMKTVAQSFAANPMLQRTLSNPYVSVDDKISLMREAAGADSSDDYINFIRLVIDHHREEFAYQMALAFCDIYREENKISRVRVITAHEMSPQRMQRIHKMVENAFPGRTFEYTETIDPALIGGFTVFVDNVKMDASISNELEQLRQNLISNN